MRSNVRYGWKADIRFNMLGRMNVPSVAVMEPLLTLDPANTEELVQACRKFIKAWYEAGNDLTDDEVIGFLSIDSQADDIGRWELDRDEDSADFYKMFYPAFIAERDAWHAFSKC